MPKAVRVSGSKGCKLGLRIPQIPQVLRAFTVSSGKPANFSNIVHIPCPPGYEPGGSQVGTCKGAWAGAAAGGREGDGAAGRLGVCVERLGCARARVR